jgi:hypothetical protein
MPMEEYLFRFVVGGLAVSAFALLGDILRPKSFAGLFGAAPSIALATLMFTVWKQGPGYVATEGQSMIIGALGLCAYSFAVCQLTKRFAIASLNATASALILWFAVAFGLQWLILG